MESSLFLILLLFTQLVWAQPTTSCSGCPGGKWVVQYPERVQNMMKVERLEEKIVKAIQANIAVCDPYKLKKIADITDVYSIISIEHDAKKKVGMQPDSGNCESCQKIKSCHIFTKEIASDLDQYLNNPETILYIRRIHSPKQVLIPKVFLSKFKKLVKEIEVGY